MDLGLEGRRAAVAAGSAGLGLATARALVAEGVRVAICGRDRDRLDAAVAELGSSAVGVVADMAAHGGPSDFARSAVEQLGGPVDIVVANAGGPPPGSASRTSVDAYRAAAGPALSGWDADAVAAGLAAGLAFHALAYARIAAAAPAARRWQLEGTVRYLVRRSLRLEGLAP